MELTLLIDSFIKQIEYIWLLIRHKILPSWWTQEWKDDPLITACMLAMFDHWYLHTYASEDTCSLPLLQRHSQPFIKDYRIVRYLIQLLTVLLEYIYLFLQGPKQPVKMHMSAPVRFYCKVQYTYIPCYNAGLLKCTWSGVSECHFERCPWGILSWQLFIKLWLFYYSKCLRLLY